MSTRPPTFDAPPFPIPSGHGASSASSASSASLSDDATLHAYPPAPASSKRRKSLEYRDDDELRDDTGRRGEGEEEERGLLDEERNVGEMMRDRAEKNTTSSKQSSASRRRGLIIVAVVFFGLILSIPILSWLSSGMSSSGAVLDINRDASWLLPNALTSKKQLRPLPTYEAARDDAPGLYGLLNAKGFSVDFVTPGWRDAGEARKLLGDEVGAESKGGKLPTMDTVMDGVFYPSTSDIAWSKEDPDEGVFTHKDPKTGDLIVEDVTHLRKDKTGEGEVAKGGGKVLYVKAEDVKDQHGQTLHWSSFKISPDMSHVLFSTDVQSRWRYSSFKNVWLHDVVAKKTKPVGGGPHYPAKTMGVNWAPRGPDGLSGASFSYVMDNDLYVQTADGKTLRVTDDGTEQVFNAIADWAYEEEVYKDEHVSWWSPSGTKLAYLRLDETAVPVYEYPIYNSNNFQSGLTTPYVKMAKMKYPKPGFPNPLVSAFVVDVTRFASGSTAADAKAELKAPKGNTRPGASTTEKDTVDTALAGERLVAEVVWTGDEEVLLRETNRVSDAARTIKFDLGRDASRQAAVVGDVVRWKNTQKEGGWIAASQEKVALGPLSKTESTAYLDVLPDAAGFRHIAYYENAGVAEPLFLTKGEWEVDELRHTDIKRRRIYFIAGSPTPSQRHLYSIELPDFASATSSKEYKIAEPVALTDTSKPGWYGASFDPKGAYYLLNYQGPSVPWVKIFGIDNAEFHLTLEDNADLKQQLAKYTMPTFVYYSIKTDHGVVVSACEKRPHDFDPSGHTRYPVLFDVYGGPNSQTVKAMYAATNWHTYLVEYLGFIVINVDGRGTGFKGRKYRTSITGRLGKDEVQDVVGAMKQVRRLPYVDETRTGVWGWSYGGYLTSKIVEADSGQFSLGMSVAPVSRWEFYDSIYTERYMKLPSTNKAGYDNASVHITDGFRNTHYLLAQGSGDDNVHFESSAHLLDMLTAAHVRGFAFRMFTDATHNISIRGAWRELHEFLTAFLVSNWGSGGLRRFEGKTANLLHLVDSRAVREENERRQERDVEMMLRRRDEDGQAKRLSR